MVKFEFMEWQAIALPRYNRQNNWKVENNIGGSRGGGGGGGGHFRHMPPLLG